MRVPACFGRVVPIREGFPMARYQLLVVTVGLLMATMARAGDSVIDMPPPPSKKAPSVATPMASADVRREVTVGDIALYRYDRTRVGASYTSYPRWRNGYYGPTSYGHHYHPYNYYPYGFGFYGCGSGVFHGTLLGGHPFFWGGNTTVTFR